MNSKLANAERPCLTFCQSVGKIGLQYGGLVLG